MKWEYLDSKGLNYQKSGSREMISGEYDAIMKKATDPTVLPALAGLWSLRYPRPSWGRGKKIYNYYWRKPRSKMTLKTSRPAISLQPSRILNWREISDLFKNKTVQGYDVKRKKTFVWHFGYNKLSDRKTTFLGYWQIKWSMLCVNKRTEHQKCGRLKTQNGQVIHYDGNSNRVLYRYTRFSNQFIH